MILLLVVLVAADLVGEIPLAALAGVLIATAHDFLRELAEVSRVRVVVLRMSRITAVDATGAHVLADTIGRLERRGVTVLLSGVRPHHENVLAQLGVYAHLAHARHLLA